MTAWLGPALAAGASLLGGFLGRENQEDQRAKNEALQREFAQNSIQWRVADAKKAGIHPLYAMGSPTMSPSVGVQSDPLAASLGAMGQDVSRAMTALNPPAEKFNVTQTALQDLQLTNMTLKNDLLAAHIAKLKQAGNPPGVPIGDITQVPTDPKVPSNKRLVMGGEEVLVDPGWSPTQDVADMYGDENPVVQYIYGPLKMWKDWMYNNDRRIPTYGSTRQRGYGRSGGGGGY